MFGTTKEFLDYFGLKKLEDLPTLAEIKDGLPELSPQTDLIESLEADARGVDAVLSQGEEGASVSIIGTAAEAVDEADDDDSADDESDLAGPDLIGEDSDDDATRAAGGAPEDADDPVVQSADVIPLRAADDDNQ